MVIIFIAANTGMVIGLIKESFEMTAQNLIDILKACAYNTKIPLNQLEVRVDNGWGGIDIQNYNIYSPLEYNSELDDYVESESYFVTLDTYF